MRKKGFTPLESPAIYGGDEKYKGLIPFRKGGVKAPSFLTGFTLIELIIVIIFFYILMAVVFSNFIVGLRVWDSGKNRADIRQGGNLAIEKMVRELSQAYSIRNAAEDEITFWADVAGNEEVTVDIQSGNLVRTVDALGTVLTRNVQALVLSYRDVNNNAMSIPADVASQDKRDNIRVITILLTLNKGDETLTVSSSSYTRNQGL